MAEGVLRKMVDCVRHILVPSLSVIAKPCNAESAGEVLPSLPCLPAPSLLLQVGQAVCNLL